MELGFWLPTSGPLAAPKNIARIAQEAERLGYDALWTYERLLRPTAEMSPPLPKAYGLVYDPLETLSYVAALTDRIALGTSIVDALFHAPVVLARRYATLDQLSNGRVIAGLGQGWMPQEFETANVPMKRKGAGFDEAIAAMRACWGPDPVEYKGRFYRIAPSEISPKPVQDHLPIIVGAMTPGGIERAARVADGLNPIAFSLDALTSAAASFHAAARAHGRDGLRVIARANVPLTLEPLGDDRPFLGGSPTQVAADIAQLEGTGVHHVFFSNTAGRDLDDEVRLLAELREAVAS